GWARRCKEVLMSAHRCIVASPRDVRIARGPSGEGRAALLHCPTIGNRVPAALRRKLTVRSLLSSLLASLLVSLAGLPSPAAEPASLTPLEKDMVEHLDRLRPELVEINQEIWNFAELGLQEHRSAARL